jgi:hypothetical protein
MVLSAGLSTDRFGFEFGSAVTALPPGGTWQSPRSLRLLSTAEHRLFVRVRQGARQWRVQRVLRPNTGLVTAAKQQCAQSSTGGRLRLPSARRWQALYRWQGLRRALPV